jgi:hypothetical protein
VDKEASQRVTDQAGGQAGIATPPEQVVLRRNGRGEIDAQIDGRKVPNVKVVRCFPWSMQDRYVSIRDKDGKEAALLENVELCEASSRAVIEQELRDRCFVPKILRIKSHQSEFDVVTISAQTDRGEVSFQIRSRDDVRTLSSTRAIFRDVDGNIYEVEDITQLDRSSQRHLERYF